MNYPKKIFAIQHNKTKRIYIGSTGNLDRIYLNLMNLLRRGVHPVEDMQKDYNEHGEDYSVYTLGTIKSAADKDQEYEWMRTYNSYIRGKGYNYMNRTATRKCMGVPHKQGLPEEVL